MATFNLGNALQSGDRARAAEQNQNLNALRIDNEKQRGVRDQQTFDENQQRANTEKLLNGIRIAQQNPNMLPQVGQQLVTDGILNEAELPGLLQRAQTDPEGFRQRLEDFESQLMFALTEAPQEDSEIPTAGTSAQGRFFGSLTEGLSPEDQARARRVQLGLDPRAVGSGAITTALDPELTEQVAESTAVIAGRKKFAEMTGASRAKTIDKGFESIQNIDKNIRNMDKAIAALEGGARTGPIESRFFPSIRSASVKLDQIRNELGLDVVGGVTFGALSKGELDLALEVALPTNLQPEELIQWLQDKKAAQEKLRGYFASQIDFVDQGGTLAGFLRQQERGNQQTEQQNVAPEGTVRTNAQGVTIVKQNGQWVKQ